MLHFPAFVRQRPTAAIGSGPHAARADLFAISGVRAHSIDSESQMAGIGLNLRVCGLVVSIVTRYTIAWIINLE